MLENSWDPGVERCKNPRYQPIVDFTYRPVLLLFNNWNTIQFINKTTSSEDFYESHKVVLDGIRNNMVSLTHTGKYGAINLSDPTTLGYYIVN